MQIGIIGLGRMGMNMSKRLIDGNIKVVAYNRTQTKVDEIVKYGGIGADSIEDMIKKLPSKKIIILMLPTGKVVKEHISLLKNLLSKDDIIVEGGNSFYKDDIRNFELLKEKDIHYLDAGISGGIWGHKIGYCTMIGGREEIFKIVEPVFKTLAPENGYLHCGEVGAGHFVKMIHNGIEYALMEAYGEGFEILKASKYGEKLDLKKVSKLWNQGSVIRSWLLELLESAFDKDADLSKIQGYVEDSGEARFTLHEAIDLGVSSHVIAGSLFKRFESRQKDVFSNKVIAALRREFGGHAAYKQGENIKTDIVGAGEIKHATPEKK